MYKSIVKPILDFIIALLGLLVLSPVFIIVMIGLAIANKGKLFFFQRRPGKDEEIFSIIKLNVRNDRKQRAAPTPKKQCPRDDIIEVLAEGCVGGVVGGV